MSNFTKLDPEAVIALKSIARSLERIAHALRDDGDIDVSLGIIANSSKKNYILDSICASIDDVAEAIRERQSKSGDDVSKSDPE